MAKETSHELSKRERQIMDAVHRRGRATAVQIRESLPDPPSGHAVRALIRILESKGRLRHVKDGVRHVYLPTQTPASARRSALRRVIEVFFKGSAERAMAALLSEEDLQLSDDDLARLSRLIEDRRKKRAK